MGSQRRLAQRIRGRLDCSEDDSWRLMKLFDDLGSFGDQLEDIAWKWEQGGSKEDLVSGLRAAQSHLGSRIDDIVLNLPGG